MTKRFILWALYICFFLLIAFLVLFLVDKVKLIVVLSVLELFLILVTISCHLMLQNIKEDDYVVIYKIRYFFLIIIDFVILLAILGVLVK